jgi:hypothetical protein
MRQYPVAGIFTRRPTMPNGGSDCCGTCWFNSRNQGQAGYGHASGEEPSFCTIRNNLPIPDPFWTYCSNHPHHNPQRISIPVGPVYVAESDSYQRKVWVPAPDTEEVRIGLLDLVRGATVEAARAYPAGFSLVEGAVLQLGELGETRALAELDRIRGFPKEPASSEPFAPNPGRLVALAEKALARILPPETIAPYCTAVAVSIAEGFAATRDPAARLVLADALEEAGCPAGPILSYLRTPLPAEQPCWIVDAIRFQASRAT